jgi:hypothetical protein
MEAPSAVKQTSAIYCSVPSLQLLGSSSKRSEKASVGDPWCTPVQKAKKNQKITKGSKKECKKLQEASTMTANRWKQHLLSVLELLF